MTNNFNAAKVKFKGKPKRKRQIPMWGVVLIVLGALILAIIGFSVVQPKGTSSNGDSYVATSSCETQIKSQLKAPATAKFNDTATLASGVWRVSGTVDSENSFGANLRSNFECTVAIDANKTATVKIQSLG